MNGLKTTDSNNGKDKKNQVQQPHSLIVALLAQATYRVSRD